MITQAAILCGGSGSRMTKAGYMDSKFLLPIGDRSVAFYFFKNLSEFGINKVHLLLGFNPHEILKATKALGQEFNISVTYSKENSPLGTGGALLAALSHLPQEFLLFQGDLLLNTDLGEITKVFSDPNIDFAQLVHPSNHVFDSDLIEIDEKRRIIGYFTKPHSEGLTIRNNGNAGVYAFRKKVFKQYQGISGKIDLDRELLPSIVEKGKFEGLALRNKNYVKDIGTPKRYEAAIKNIEQFYSARQKKAAVFLDRDGTINKLAGFITQPSQIELISGVPESIFELNKFGYLVIVVTNQPVIARGEVSIKGLNSIHAQIEMELAKSGAVIDEFYFCPHHPETGFAGEIVELKIDCNCRKPNAGMLEQAIQDFDIDLNNSWIVGDSWRDVELGHNFGLQVIRVGTGVDPDKPFDAENLSKAVKIIFETKKKNSS